MTMTMQQPRLTFACELDPARLTALFADPTVIADLQALGARVALMLSDLSAERAAVVRKLNTAGIPVIAIPLVPLEQGYYFTADNPQQSAARYEEWKAWTAQQELIWAGVGLDIEPAAQFYLQLMENRWGVLPLLLSRLRDRERPRGAAGAYAALVERIHTDGYQVENYQFPLIRDERRARSTLLQRLLGLVDVRTDREVWMLYTSVLGNIGPGLLWSYAPEAAAVGAGVGVGSTGGGPDIPGHPQVPALSWEGLARDLRAAMRCGCDDLLIHSLEGCVEQGFLAQLRSFDWKQAEAATPPQTAQVIATGLRGLLRCVLWASAHPWRVVLGGTIGSAIVILAAIYGRLRPARTRCASRRSSAAALGR